MCVGDIYKNHLIVTKLVITTLRTTALNQHYEQEINQLSKLIH